MKHPKFQPAFIAVIAIVTVLSCQSRGGLAEAEARKYVQQGALVVDVRTVEEFNAKHISGVINIPLAEVRERLPKLVTNRSDVVLLHCRSGRRSGIAEQELRSLGYSNVFNIGGFDQAAKMIEAARQ